MVRYKRVMFSMTTFLEASYGKKRITELLNEQDKGGRRGGGGGGGGGVQ